MPSMFKNKKRLKVRGGFTLSELLVVMLVVAVLVGLVISGLSRARELGRIADCLSNLRQLALAANSYAAHDDRAFPSDYGSSSSPNGYWCAELKPYDTDMAANLLCPDAYTPASAVGSAAQAWGPMPSSSAYGWTSPTVASYGMNSHLDPGSGVSAVAAFGTAGLNGKTVYNGSVTSASNVVDGGFGQVSGNITAGGSITLDGNTPIGGTVTANVPGMQPPNVTTLYNQIMEYDNPYPVSSGRTIDFTNHPYLIISGNFNTSGQLTIIGSGTLLVAGNVTFNGQFPSVGDPTPSMNIVTLGSVTITGQMSLNGYIYAAGDYNNNGNHSINGGLVIGGIYNDQGKGYINTVPPPAFDPRAGGMNFYATEPIFADCIWMDGAPQPTDAVPQNLATGDQTLNSNDQMGRFCIDRHLGAVNVSFTDGSASTVPLAGLWQLNWYPGFHPTAVTVP